MKARLKRFLREASASLSPTRFPYGPFTLALILAAIGGALFAWLRLPLPWLLGAMIACLVASLFSLPVAAPDRVRSPMVVVIGVMLGSSFGPDTLEDLRRALPTLLGLLVFLPTVALISTAYFRRLGGFDPATAYLSGMPGGLAEMVAIGAEKGADIRMIALVQTGRVMLIVMTLPFLIAWFSGQVIARTTGMGSATTGFTLLDVPLFLVMAMGGVLVGRLLRLPAYHLFGPLLVSAVLHATGWTTFTPPAVLVAAAQIVLGAAIGCRFAGFPRRLIGRILALSAGSTAILIGATLAFAEVASLLTGQPFLSIALAYSPGGLTEMSLIAYSLQLDVVFVTIHHVFRVVAVMIGGALILRKP